MMIITKRFRIPLYFSICLLFAACGSDKEPVAETFLGNWTIFQKDVNNSGPEGVSGEMKIDFGNEVILFELRIEDETAPVSIKGIVYNEYLYTNSTRKEKLGNLQLTKSSTLNIMLNQENGESVIYYGR